MAFGNNPGWLRKIRGVTNTPLLAFAVIRLPLKGPYFQFPNRIFYVIPFRLDIDAVQS
jgi:hypothetical protein